MEATVIYNLTRLSKSTHYKTCRASIYYAACTLSVFSRQIHLQITKVGAGKLPTITASVFYVRLSCLPQTKTHNANVEIGYIENRRHWRSITKGHCGPLAAAVLRSSIAGYRVFLSEEDADTLARWADNYGVSSIQEWARAKILELEHGIKNLTRNERTSTP